MEMSIEHYYTELLKCSVGVLLKEGSILLNDIKKLLPSSIVVIFRILKETFKENWFYEVIILVSK